MFVWHIVFDTPARHGFTYHSVKTAGEFNRFHSNCDSAVVLGHGGLTEVEGYEPEALRAAWSDARATVGLKDARNLTASEHELISRELSRRDPEWVMTGKVPEVTYDEKINLKLIRKHEHELASIIANYGIKIHFKPDELQYFDASKGAMQTIGFTDASKGIELKTLLSASSPNTVFAHIRNAVKSKTLNCLSCGTVSQAQSVMPSLSKL